MSEKRSISEIIADLSRPRPEYVKQKTLKGNRIDFLEWHSAVRILDECAPGWHSEVKQVISEAGKIAVVVRICVPCAEGLVWREAIGNEDDDASGYGDPFSNAEAMAFKRAAAKFGVGLYLYSKDAPAPSAPQRTAPAPSTRPEPSQGLCNPAQVSLIRNLLKVNERTPDEVTSHYKVAQLGDLTARQAELTIARLQAINEERLNAKAEPDVLAGVPDRPNMSGTRS